MLRASSLPRFPATDDSSRMTHPSRLRHLGPLGILLGLGSLVLTLAPWAPGVCVRVGEGQVRCVHEVFQVDGWWSGPSTWFSWALALGVVGTAAMIALGRRTHLAWRITGGLLCVLASLAALVSLAVAAVFSIGMNL